MIFAADESSGEERAAPIADYDCVGNISDVAGKAMYYGNAANCEEQEVMSDEYRFC